MEGIERLPPELESIADQVHVHFPWGSLLRGLVDGSRSIIGPIANLLKPGAELCVLVSAVERDGLPAVAPSLVVSRSPAFAEHGLDLIAAAWATTSVIAESRSAWAKRLGAGRARPAVFARYRRLGS